MTATRKPILAALLGLALTGCGKLADDLFCSSGGCGFSDSEWARVASLANPDNPLPDLSNEFGDTPWAAWLGQRFFFDPAFSGNATQLDAIRRESPAARSPKAQPIGISCATCHDLERGGADTSSSPGHVSVGAGWTDVNALSVLNSAYRQVVFWNGRADSLWALNAVVAESSTTMNGDRLNTAHVIATRYAAEYEQAFGIGTLDVAAIAALPAHGKPGNNVCDTDPAVIATEPFGDAWDCLNDPQDILRPMVTRILVNWSKAIAAYEYQLISRNSPFDKFVTEGRDSTQISAAAKRGARLFVGKGACIDCHSGPQLTDEQFHDIGVPQSGTAVPRTFDCPQGGAACDCSEQTTNVCPPWGAWDGLRRLQGTKLSSPARPNNWLRTGKWSGTFDDSRETYVALPDKPDFDKLKGAWRTPSLRNVALTAPYMHDGYYASLKDVIWHYNNGAATAGPEQIGVPAPQIKPLLLTESEQDDLVAFLETLTGEPLSDDLRQPPPLPPVGGWASGTGGAGGGSGGSAATGTGGMATGGRGSTPTGAGGVGGMSGSLPPLVCMPMRAPPVVTNFDTARGTNPITFGSPDTIPGRTFSSAPAGLPPPVPMLVTGTNGTLALRFMARPPAPPAPPPAGLYVFGLTFDYCVDVPPAVRAVRFSIDTRVPDCPIEVGVMSVLNATSTDDSRGRCGAAACPPLFTPIIQSGVVIAPFGPADAFDQTAVIGIQWRAPASCGADVIIDDVTFVSQ